MAQLGNGGGGSQKNLARRVSFNESTLTRQSINYDTESQIAEQTKVNNEHKRHICCNYCCAWTSIIIGTFVLVLMILGIIFFSLFESNMPDFVVTGIQFEKLDLNTTGSDTALNADVIVVMNVTNRNSKFELYYESITFETTLDDLYLGKTHVPELRQKDGVTTTLKPEMVVNGTIVAEADGKKVMDDLINREMLISVTMEGRIHYFINGNTRMAGFPFRVTCPGIPLNQLDAKQPAKCRSKLTPVS